VFATTKLIEPICVCANRLKVGSLSKDQLKLASCQPPHYSQLSHNPYLLVDGPGYGLSESMALERYAKNRFKKLGKFENDTSQIHGEIHHEKYCKLSWVIPIEKNFIQRVRHHENCVKSMPCEVLVRQKGNSAGQKAQQGYF
jgi:hypothetical protein